MPGYNPDELREGTGPHPTRWTTGGGGGDSAVERHLLDPRVTDVGGDEWNRKTAERLEKEYAAVRPEIDAIATEVVLVTPSDWKVVEHPDAGGPLKFALQASNGTYGLNANGVGINAFATIAEAEASKATYSPTQSLMDDEEPDAAPKEWGDLTGSQQEEAESSYKDNHIDAEITYAHDNWVDEGGAMQAAKEELAQDDDFKSEFIAEFIADRTENDEARIPFNVGDLAGAINIKPGDEGGDDPEITFDEEYLKEPDNFLHGGGQMQLPGIEPQNPADFLTEKMRADITTALTKAFNKEALSKADHIDPPDYLDEQAQESVQDSWDNMDEDEQFSYAKENVDSLKEAPVSYPAVPQIRTTNLAWPSKFDPLNKTSGTDYQRTQALAKFIADKRGAQLITERTDAGIIGAKRWEPGVGPTLSGSTDDFRGWKPRDKFLGSDADYAKLYGPGGVGAKKDAAWTARMQKELQQADFKLWAGWKGSSTGPEGRLLQVAASDELGGRIREAKPNAPASRLFGDQMTVAESKYKAKLILSDTGDYYDPELKAQAQKYMDENKFSVDDPKKSNVLELDSENVNGYIRLPKVIVDKNGAASTTVSQTVANQWNGTTNNAPEGINKKESIAYANKEFAAIGGYEGVKAAMRAKWETTQYLLDKADTPVVDLYRGMKVEHVLKGVADKSEFNAPYSGIVKEVGPFGEKSHDLAKMAVGDQIKTALGKTITKVSMTGGGY